ncbi:MAG: HAD hydrolase-like protein [Thermoplasmata archaeon]
MDHLGNALSQKTFSQSVVCNDNQSEPRKFRHIFLDAEGTLYVPKYGRSRWEFWVAPSPEHALDFFELDEGVPEALEKLRREVDTLCVVSRNTAQILEAILTRFGIRHYFDAILLNGDKGEKISRYLEERGLDKQDAVMVGDTPSLDLHPVLRAGICAILVDRDYNRTVRAERIKGIRELPTWLRLAEIADEMVRSRARTATLDEFLPSDERPTKRLMAAPSV